VSGLEACRWAKDNLALVISGFSTLVALISLMVAFLTAWNTTLKSPRFVGAIDYLVFCGYSSKGDGILTDSRVAPSLWLSNQGAQSAVILDLRLAFASNDKDKEVLYCYPTSSVPRQAIENPSSFTENDIPFIGGPFSSFVLSAKDTWLSSFYYVLSDFRRLRGRTSVTIEIKTPDKKRWQAVCTEEFDFGKGLHPFMGGTVKAGVEKLFFYPTRVRERRPSAG